MLRAIRSLSITVIAAVPLAAWAQSPGLPQASRVSAATFSSQGVVLSGDLYMPTAPVAALVLVHGSGPSNRMGPIARLFADYGFAVLTYDKRGVGQSQGKYEGDNNTSAANLALLAADASAAMGWLSTQPALGELPRGYWGISQAGWIIPIAAARTPNVDFITLWSGPVCTVTEEMESGIGTGGNQSSDARVRAYIAALREQRADTDPRDALRRIGIPGLWLFGGRDDTLPVQLSIARLSGLIDSGQRQFEYRLTPEAGHLMNIDRDRETIEVMVEWMKRRGRGR